MLHLPNIISSAIHTAELPPSQTGRMFASYQLLAPAGGDIADYCGPGRLSCKEAGCGLYMYIQMPGAATNTEEVTA